MMRLIAVLGFLTIVVCAQDWMPTHIEAITEYPRLAWIAQATGDVVVKCTLDKNGSVVKAEASSGPGLLKQQAPENAALWKFQRTRSTKADKASTATLTYQYRIDGKLQERQTASFAVDLPSIIHITAGHPPP